MKMTPLGLSTLIPCASRPEPLRAPPTRATTPTASFPAPVVAKPRAPFEEEGLVRFHETQAPRSREVADDLGRNFEWEIHLESREIDFFWGFKEIQSPAKNVKLRFDPVR